MASLINDGQPFPGWQRRDAGFSKAGLSRALARGQVRRPLRSVYIDGRVPDTRDLRLLCLSLVIKPPAVVWGRTAAWALGLDCFGIDDRQLLTPECAVPHHRSRLTGPGVRTVERVLPTADVMELGGVIMTVPVRTALDLARCLKRPDALAALDTFAHAGAVTVEEMQEVVRRFAGYPGIKQARELVGYVEPKTESPGESWLRLRVIDAGFPHPEPQIWVCDRWGRPLFRLDLGYRAKCLGLEYDGEEYHGPEQAAHDAERRRRCRDEFGWDVYGFDRGHVLGRYPHVELAVGELLGIEPRLPRRW